MISVAAELVRVHPRTLRIYELEGLICPARTRTNIRLYSENDIRRVLWIRHLTRNLGVNLAGVRVLFELEERLGMRILETLYEDSITAQARKDEQRTNPARSSKQLEHDTPAAKPLTRPDPSEERNDRDNQSGRAGRGREAEHRDPESTTSRRRRAAVARASARRAARDGHLPGDDRPAPGGPRQVGPGAQQGRRRQLADRARDPASG